MAFSSLADELELELDLDAGPSSHALSLALSPGGFGPSGGLSLADEFDDLDHHGGLGEPHNGLGSLAHELDHDFHDDDAYHYDDDHHDHGYDPHRDSRTNGHAPAPSPPRPRSRARGTRANGNGVSSRTPDDTDEDDDAAASLPPQSSKAIAALHDSLSHSARFVALLRAPASGAAALEERLSAHLSHLAEAERARDEQVREAGVLLRELEAVRGEGIDADLSWVDELGLGGALDDDGPAGPGWTGDRVPGNKKLLSPSPPGSPLSPTFRQHAAEAAAASPLPRAAAELSHGTASLARSLAGLSDSAGLALALSNGAARQVRGVRIGVSSWREREETEAECLAGVEAWEARAAAGELPDVRRVADALVKGFADMLDDVERRMREARRVGSVGA
ncbi:uncharacterized protein LOC62_03G005042 [Vanrija pseudolonga]|uniref:Uncharacterized protein n=1 Tax=Vanrija pseudolonga TaxID=143232 RepID=A0AAF0Y7L5_9TREE|nr:hypothetical protein LOC62_03G005042 [Vanrija pseudolonga]